MESRPLFSRRDWRVGPTLACCGVLVLFAAVCSQFWLRGVGFSALAAFGGERRERSVPELQATPHYEIAGSQGYDGEYYAQMAMHPRWDASLVRALDDPAYRGRRVLFSWTAQVLAGGDARRALQIYCIQNIAAWLLLAVLLWRWLPPSQWENVLRWAGVLLSFGLCFSVRFALLEGPSLLLLAVTALLAERDRRGWATLVLGVAGLGRETNLLGVVLLAPTRWTWGDARRWLGRIVLAALPVMAWAIYLNTRLDDAGQGASRNFAIPFAAYFAHWQETVAVLWANGWGSVEKWRVPILIALTAQFLFFALRWRRDDPWWRLGAVHAVLMMFLGLAVWEGYPGAAVRVLLPMQLAFNLCVPRGRRGWAVLLLGNISILGSADILHPPAGASYRVETARGAAKSEALHISFDASWYPAERSWFEYWRWSRGAATLTVHNPSPTPVHARVTFGARANEGRRVSLREGARELWSGTLAAKQRRKVQLDDVVFAPGDTTWTFAADQPAEFPGGLDYRPLAFSVRDLKIVVQTER